MSEYTVLHVEHTCSGGELQTQVDEIWNPITVHYDPDGTMITIRELNLTESLDIIDKIAKLDTVTRCTVVYGRFCSSAYNRHKQT